MSAVFPALHVSQTERIGKEAPPPFSAPQFLLYLIHFDNQTNFPQ